MICNGFWSLNRQRKPLFSIYLFIYNSQNDQINILIQFNSIFFNLQKTKESLFQSIILTIMIMCNGRRKSRNKVSIRLALVSLFFGDRGARKFCALNFSFVLFSVVWRLETFVCEMNLYASITFEWRRKVFEIDDFWTQTFSWLSHTENPEKKKQKKKRSNYVNKSHFNGKDRINQFRTFFSLHFFFLIKYSTLTWIWGGHQLLLKVWTLEPEPEYFGILSFVRSHFQCQRMGENKTINVIFVCFVTVPNGSCYFDEDVTNYSMHEWEFQQPFAFDWYFFEH